MLRLAIPTSSLWASNVLWCMTGMLAFLHVLLKFLKKNSQGAILKRFLWVFWPGVQVSKAISRYLMTKAIFHRNMNRSRLSTSSMFVYPSSLLVHMSSHPPVPFQDLFIVFVCFFCRLYNSVSQHDEWMFIVFICTFTVLTALHPPTPFHVTTNEMFIVCMPFRHPYIPASSHSI